MAVIQYTSDTLNKCTVSPNNITKSTTTIVIQANSGYKFSDLWNRTVSGNNYIQSSPFIYFLFSTEFSFNTNANSSVGIVTNKTISDDKKTITLTVDLSTISGTVSSVECRMNANYPILIDDTPQYPILTLYKNLTGCEILPDDSQIEITGNTQVLTLSLNQNYQWNTTPTITIDNVDYNFTLNNNVYTFDLSTVAITQDTNATIIAIAEQTPIATNPILTINKNMTNCVLTPDVNSIEIDGQSHILTLTPNSNSDFRITPKITIDNVDYDFTLINDVYSIDISLLGINQDSTGTINASADIYKNVTLTTSNCVLSNTPNKIYIGDTIQLTVNANNGYIFQTTPRIDFHNRSSYYEDFVKVTNYQYTLNITVNNLDNFNSNITIECIAAAETIIIRKYGTIQVYKPTSNDMKTLSQVRFIANGSSGGVTYDDIDLGKYITQFKRVFVDVNTSNTSNIFLGRHNTNITTDIVDDDIVNIDLGNVLLNGYFHNELDTKIYKINLILTCYGIYELDSKYMNKTINISYKCNIITGYADIIISEIVDNIKLPIDKLRCKISQDLPYIINVEQLKNNIEDDVFNEVPKIILQKQNILESVFDTLKEDFIYNENGYFTVDRIISHSINAPLNELNEIESLLKLGVTI